MDQELHGASRQVMTSFSVTIPHPPASLKANAGTVGNWRKKVRATRDYKGCVKLLVKQKLDGKPPPHWKRARLSVTWKAKSHNTPGIHPSEHIGRARVIHRKGNVAIVVFELFD